MSTVRIKQLSAPVETDQKTAPLESIPLIIHHIWFSTPLPKKIVFPHDEEDRGDIFEKLKEEHNANKHLPNFRLILWTNGADNLDIKKYIDENELEKIEVKDYNSLRLEPECHRLDEIDEEIMKFMAEELSQPAGNPVAASDMFRLLVLKHLAGFYSDVNDEPPYILTDSQALIPSLGCWVGGDNDGACNNLLAAVKNHQLVQDTLVIIANNYKEKGVQFIFEERKIDRWNPVQHSGPGPLGTAIANIFKKFTFFNKKKWSIGLTEEGREHLHLSRQKFFTAANKIYRTGTGNSWVRSDFANSRPTFLFNDAEINDYSAKRSAM